MTCEVTDSLRRMLELLRLLLNIPTLELELSENILDDSPRIPWDRHSLVQAAILILVSGYMEMTNTKNF